MPRIERKELPERFRGMIARKEPIVGAGAGTGLSAKCEEVGGASSMERLPVETALTQQVRAFKKITF
jgi:predicted TIM-barrel enzyme